MVIATTQYSPFKGDGRNFAENLAKLKYQMLIDVPLLCVHVVGGVGLRDE